MKILCLGNATYDITYPLDNFLKENTKNRISEIIKCGGGPASTAAYLLGKWGANVYFAGIVGNDSNGLEIKQEFDKVNVNTDYLELNDYIETTSNVVIVNKQNGSRTILSYKNENIQMTNFDLDFIPDVILIDGQEYEMSNKLLDLYPNCLSIIDAGRNTKEIIELCKKVNWVVCSKDFAQNVTGIEINYNNDSLISIYKKLKLLFKNEIIITLEDKGSFYNYELIKSIKTKNMDSTGAGDIFHGAFTYYLSKGYEIKNAIKLANYAGAISVDNIGTRNSIPNKDDVEVIYNEFK